MKNKIKIHFIGISGIGMSGIAELMKDQGYLIQGSDINLNDNSRRLKRKGIKFFIGHNQKNIKSIDVVRRVTRDIGSSFRLDGKDVRARDVQIMFADSSTGAHSPSLVRQGQVSELINANPKSRRAILEEAAGISGLYQRRHEAELKLKASETNLERVDDILQQLLVQVKTLEKQARQAAHYKEIGEKIRHNESLLLFNRWFELDKNFQATSNEKNILQNLTGFSLNRSF